MNLNSINYTSLNLIKINLKISNLSKKLVLSFILFLLVSYKIMNSLQTFGINNNFNVNFWDGVFRVSTYPMIILGLYLPFMIIITTSFNMKISYSKFIFIRTRKKYTWIINRFLCNMIISLLFTITLFLSIFITSYLFFGFENNWSSVILDKSNIKLASQLYVNNFVFSLTPFAACFISFLGISLCTAIITNLRDILANYIRKNYISNLIVSFYLFINIIAHSFNLKSGLFTFSSYIGLDTMAIICYHNFGNFKYFKLTIYQSLMISFLFLIALLLIDLLLSRKLVVDYD